MKYLQSILLSSLFFCLLILSAYAKPLAKVYALKGKASKNKGHILKVEELLYQSDHIQTELESMLLLLLHNGYLVKIDEDLSLNIEDIVLLKAKKSTQKLENQLNQLLGNEQRSHLQFATMETFAVTHSEELSQSAAMSKEVYHSSFLKKAKPDLPQESTLNKKPSPSPAPISSSSEALKPPAPASSLSPPGAPTLDAEKKASLSIQKERKQNANMDRSDQDQTNDGEKRDGLGLQGIGEGGGGRSNGIGLGANQHQATDHQSNTTALRGTTLELSKDETAEEERQESSSDDQAKEIQQDTFLDNVIEEGIQEDDKKTVKPLKKRVKQAEKQAEKQEAKSMVDPSTLQAIQHCLQEALPPFENDITSINVTIYVKVTKTKPFRIKKIFLGEGLEAPKCLKHQLFAKLPFFKTPRPHLLQHVITIDLTR